MDHELLRNLILGVRAGLANHDYAVIRRERPLEEDILSVELGGTWLADRHTSVEVSYRFEKKGSTVSADQYDAGVVSVSLRLNM